MEIRYTLKPNELPDMKQRELRNGIPVDHPQGPAVRFQAGEKNVYVLLSTHPELRPQVEAYKAAIEAREALREGLREAVIAACPVDHVPAEQVWSNGDLCAAKYRLVGTNQEVLGPDYLEPAGEGIYYLPMELAAEALAQAEEERRRQEWLNEPIPPEALADYQRWAGLPTLEEMAAYWAKSPWLAEWGARIEHQHPELKVDPNDRIPIPDYALRAYRRYGGDPERAWEAGDEEAWALLREWGGLIERRNRIRSN